VEDINVMWNKIKKGIIKSSLKNNRIKRKHTKKYLVGLMKNVK